MKEEIFTLKMNGYCCSQIVMDMGLRRLGRENPDLIEAMAGLCYGAKCGRLCGVVSAAVCLLCLADSRAESKGLIQEFLDWFEDAFQELDCEALLGDDPMAKVEKCPMLVESGLLKLSELLEWDE